MLLSTQDTDPPLYTCRHTHTIPLYSLNKDPTIQTQSWKKCHISSCSCWITILMAFEQACNHKDINMKHKSTTIHIVIPMLPHRTPENKKPIVQAQSWKQGCISCHSCWKTIHMSFTLHIVRWCTWIYTDTTQPVLSRSRAATQKLFREAITGHMLTLFDQVWELDVGYWLWYSTTWSGHTVHIVSYTTWTCTDTTLPTMIHAYLHSHTQSTAADSISVDLESKFKAGINVVATSISWSVWLIVECNDTKWKNDINWIVMFHSCTSQPKG